MGNPYRGLRAYTSQDAAYFFGRDDIVASVLEALAAHRPELVVLVGNSGVGNPEHARVLAECERRLRAVLSPEEIDARAKAEQAAKLERAGGREAVVARGDLGFSPRRALQPSLRELGRVRASGSHQLWEPGRANAERRRGARLPLLVRRARGVSERQRRTGNGVEG